LAAIRISIANFTVFILSLGTTCFDFKSVQIRQWRYRVKGWQW